MTILTKNNFRFIILHTLNVVHTGFYYWEKCAQLKIFAHTGHKN